MNDHKHRQTSLRREWWLTTAIALALLIWLIFGEIARPMGNVLYDHLMRLQGFRATQNIVILAIDDRSIQELGGWPIQRSHYSKLLKQLNNDCCRPKVIGLDLLFLDRSSDDIALAEQLKQHTAVLPLAFKVQENAHLSLQPVLPVEPLGESAALGHINLSFDSDGVIRGFQTHEQNWAHFALEMHAQGLLSASFDTSSALAYRRFRMVDPRIGFPMISFADAMNSHASQTLLKDKYVLIGVTAPSLGDRYPTLYAGKNNASTPGVAILASVLNASLNKALIDEATPWTLFLLTLPLLIVMLQSLVLLQPRQSLMFAVLMTLGSIFTSYVLLSFADYWIDPIPFVLVAVLLQPLWAWRRLEAIVRLIQNKAADLQQLQPTERASKKVNASREVVLQNARLLDDAVASARSEFGFLSAIIDEMPDAVLIFNAHNQLLLRNQKVKQLFNTNLSASCDIHDFTRQLHLPPNIFKESITSTALHRQKVLQINTILGQREFVLKTALLNSPLGNNLQLFILIDVTELKQSQKQRDRALQFLSHDMRTPIASILSLTRPDFNESPLDVKYTKVTHHAQALLQMMDDFILTISAEAAEYKFQSESLDNLLNDSLEQVSDLAIAKGVFLRDTTEASDIFVRAHTRLLVRAFVNLLFNAIKFSPVQSTISLQSQRTREATSSQTYITLVLSNIVATETRSDRFNTHIPGFGLGLDFVDNVIHKHHGTILRKIPLTGVATVEIKLPCEISVVER